jgi:hypothetical protein
MPNTLGSDPLDNDHAQAMEVHGFDLLAQVEAMLRYVRAYQQNVQELRRTPLLPAVRRKSAASVLDNVKELRKVCDTFCTALDDVAVSVEEASRRFARAKS